MAQLKIWSFFVMKNILYKHTRAYRGLKYPKKYLGEHSQKSLGMCGRNFSHGHNLRHFGPSCAHLVSFYVSIQSFMAYRWSVKEFSLIFYFLFLINPHRFLSADLFRICYPSPIAISMLLR